jgi:rare lipoprotein A
MKLSHVIAVLLALALSACSGSDRPVYSGHEESTAGVPGFSKTGKKKTPYAKLGQSYRVGGKTYVPRYQPDYSEEGMASWYGPGFHGGKTANGEEFDKHAMTAAHKTLPLPSIVKVTMLETGKEAIVRVNDRGPFSKGRIIDLSYAAAKEIGLIAKGTARVRVEYMKEESERFANLLVEGRDPTSIDLAEEVLNQSSKHYAKTESTPEWKTLPTTTDAAVDSVIASDLPSPNVKPVGVEIASAEEPKTGSPFSVLEEFTTASSDTVGEEMGKHFLQLGAFLQQSNADRLRIKAAKLGPVRIESKAGDDAPLMYVVRMGPYVDANESAKVMDQLAGLGITPKRISQE